jgi:predicted glutamine amidotransferase
MCELLGMSANVPTDICFSFSGLIRRSKSAGAHKDGWGVAFYEGKGVRNFLEPSTALDSKLAKLVQSYPIKSTTVISHIRKANCGKVSLANTHPFVRELWGHNWVFAHNGQVKPVMKKKLKFFRPIGETDSEYAFCWILDQLRARLPGPVSERTLHQTIASLVKEINALGTFNVLMSNGVFLYAHCATHLWWLTRKSPFGQAHLIDADLKVDFKRHTTSKDVVTVIATKPLTFDEDWTMLNPGELKIFSRGAAFE